MKSVHLGQVGFCPIAALKASGVDGSGAMSASGLGILNFLSLAFLPWQVEQSTFLNFSASKSWKALRILGVITAFMYLARCSPVMSFQATSGGPTTLTPAAGA